jgi:hypothetical protein
MQTFKHSALALSLTYALVACSSDDAKAPKKAGSEDDAEVEQETDPESEPENDAGAAASDDTVPLTVWVDDLIEQRTSDEAEPDSVDDKKISDDSDEASFDKYLP